MKMQSHPIKGPFRIGTVSEMTGLSTHVIRVWERRYEAVKPNRSVGKNRLYAHEEVERLRLLKKLVDQGHSIGGIANLPTPVLQQLATVPHEGEESGQPSDQNISFDTKQTVLLERIEHAPPFSSTHHSLSGRSIVDSFVGTIQHFDTQSAENLLSRAATSMPLEQLIEFVLQPAIKRIGELWEQGTLRPAHEHAATAVLRSLLGSLMRMQDAPYENAPTVVLATLAGDMHEFGILLSAMKAVASGFKTLYLGPNLPVNEILFACREKQASMLILSCVYGKRGYFREQLTRLRQGLGQPLKNNNLCEIVAGGAGINPNKTIEGVHLLHQLQDLDAVLNNHLLTSAPAPSSLTKGHE